MDCPRQGTKNMPFIYLTKIIPSTNHCLFSHIIIINNNYDDNYDTFTINNVL